MAVQGARFRHTHPPTDPGHPLRLAPPPPPPPSPSPYLTITWWMCSGWVAGVAALALYLLSSTLTSSPPLSHRRDASGARYHIEDQTRTRWCQPPTTAGRERVSRPTCCTRRSPVPATPARSSPLPRHANCNQEHSRRDTPSGEWRRKGQARGRGAIWSGWPHRNKVVAAFYALSN